jgi:hypothetical protein
MSLVLFPVSIINRTAYPLSRQLDSSAGEMVLRRIEALGVKVHTEVNVKDMLVEKDEESGSDVFKGFEFDDGEVVGERISSLLISSSFRPVPDSMSLLFLLQRRTWSSLLLESLLETISLELPGSNVTPEAVSRSTTRS